MNNLNKQFAMLAATQMRPILAFTMLLLPACGASAPDSSADHSDSKVAMTTSALTTISAVSAPISTDGGASSASGPTIPTYGGGAIISPEIVTLYWGNFTASDQSSMQSFFSGLATHLSGVDAPFGQEPTTMAYGVYGATLGATYLDTSLPSGGHANQTDAQNEIAALQAAGDLPQYSPERVFIVLSNGISWDQTVDGGTYGTWCAYHGAFAANQYFAITPLPSVSGCGSTGFGGFGQNSVYQAQISHETFEAASDPGIGATTLGWTPEIGDGCNWGNTPSNMVTFPFGTIQKVVDRLQDTCSTFTDQQSPSTTAVSWASGRADFIALGGSRQAVHRAWDSSNGFIPSTWEQHGGGFASTPVMVSWGADRLDVFGQGTDNAYYHQAWDGTAWQPSITGWESHGGVFVAQPSVTSWAANRLDVFGRGSDGAYYHQAYDGTWHPSQTTWENHGGTFISPPATVSWGAGRLDIFGLGTDGNIYHQSYDGTGGTWSPSETTWEGHGGTFISPPVAVSWGTSRIDVFAQGTDGALYHQAFDGTTWYPSMTTWEAHGGGFIGIPAVNSWGVGRIDLFGEGADMTMYHQAFDGTEWTPSTTTWEGHGGGFESGAALTTITGANSLMIFGSGTDGSLYAQSWSGAWMPSQTGWTSLGNISNL